MNTARFVLSASVLVVLASCAALNVNYIAPPAPPENAKLTLGRRLYLTKCVRCHAPEPVAKYSLEEWHHIMPDMVADSKLPPNEGEALMEYVKWAHKQALAMQAATTAAQ
ncbi:MAG: hypothetical protein JNJ83_08905 [Verrucomicrobiaceae bacterium]|nr:hypothetical protein [Verrucomicrobiaceae bacterium]